MVGPFWGVVPKCVGGFSLAFVGKCLWLKGLVRWVVLPSLTWVMFVCCMIGKCFACRLIVDTYVRF